MKEAVYRVQIVSSYPVSPYLAVMAVGEPARGYTNTHPPFEPGNAIALKHGAHSPRVVAAKVDELEPAVARWISDRAPWASAPEFELARQNYVRHLAVVSLLYDDVTETAARQGPAKVPTRRFETLLTALRGELAALGQLGLTPPTKAGPRRP